MRAVVSALIGVAGLFMAVLALIHYVDGDGLAAVMTMGCAVATWLVALLHDQASRPANR